jgi:Methyltransferase domain
MRPMPETVQTLEEKVAQRDAELAEAWGRYHSLRNRKAVRAALAAAQVRPFVTGLVRRLRPEPPAAAPPPPVEEGVRHTWPLGHYYSPVPDTRELEREPARSRVWPPTPPPTPGIEWRAQAQRELVGDLAAQEQLVFPAGPTGDPTDYHAANDLFSPLDAWALQGVLRHVRPARIIEVGCGWSSLVTARVNREHLGGAARFTCIEPYPQDFLGDGIDGLTELVVAPVQDVPIERFLELRSGDVLFIDTSHVVKTGNDVRFLYHEVLPRLEPGVVVHVHDIFLPWDYPQDWVLAGRGWNEQYLLQSFLTFNDRFEVMLGVAWMAAFHPDELAAAAAPSGATLAHGGGSIWLRRVRS